MASGDQTGTALESGDDRSSAVSTEDQP